MVTRIADEIKQTRPFASLEQEAMLNIERTAAVLGHGFAESLKPYGITPTQYNVLRILRGAGAGGLCRHEVGARLVSQVPDVTRLLDRLVEMQLIARERDTVDRRQMVARITRDGLRLLAALDAPTAAMHRAQLGHMGPAKLEQLIALLAEAREHP